MRSRGILVIGTVCGLGASGALADVLFEDTVYWMPDGSCLVNPEDPPEDAYVKIQETVYDDAQGKALLAEQLGFGLIVGPGVPAGAVNVYCYAITNLNYGNGPIVGGGAGIGGFNIIDVGVPLMGIWAPTAANDLWEAPAGNTPDYEWDIDANGNGANGDGIGILLGQSTNSFYLAVADGTLHGFLDAWVHTWSGGGALEQPDSTQVDVVFGCVSGPVPAPAGLALLGLAGLAVAKRRR